MFRDSSHILIIIQRQKTLIIERDSVINTQINETSESRHNRFAISSILAIQVFDFDLKGHFDFSVQTMAAEYTYYFCLITFLY